MFRQIQGINEVYGDGSGLLLHADASGKLPELQPYIGQVQVVYIDPPFLTGDKYAQKRKFGEKGWRTGSPAPEYPAYNDVYPSRRAYLEMLRGVLENARELLTPFGVFYVHVDWHASHYVRVLCDEVFGEDRFINEIIWAYESGGRAKKFFSRKHDTILMYSKTRDYRFDLSTVPLERTSVRRNHLKRNVDENGREYRSVVVGGKEYRYYDDDPVYPGDVWTDISILQQRDPERTGFPTQKPRALLERLLKPLVKPGDMVADLCCGSGTTLDMASRMGCRVLGVDKQPEALITSLNRIKDLNLTVISPDTEEGALLEGSWSAKSAVLFLDGFEAKHPAFPEILDPLDSLESWGAGRLKDGRLYVEQRFFRSRNQPMLPRMCMLEESDLPMAVTTVDAAGRRRVFVWIDE